MLLCAPYLIRKTKLESAAAGECPIGSIIRLLGRTKFVAEAIRNTKIPNEIVTNYPIIYSFLQNIDRWRLIKKRSLSDIFSRPYFATVHSLVQIKKGCTIAVHISKFTFISSPTSPFDIPHLTHISFNMTIIEVIYRTSLE